MVALRPCSQHGCPALVPKGACDAHRQAPGTQPRLTASQRGYDSRWQRARATYLAHAENALCRQCKSEKRLTPATVVDHIIPHRGSQALFWDTKNWQPLCHSCHSRKTATEDEGFGNQPKPRNHKCEPRTKGM